MTDPNAPLPTVALGQHAISLGEALARLRSSGHWFWWIAALSLINTLATLMDSGYGMLLGLGMTQIIDALVLGGGEPTTAARVVHAVLVLSATGLFVVFGHFARRGHVLAFGVGMAVYALDTLVFVAAKDWIGVGFHVFVLWALSGGLGLLRAIRAQHPGLLPLP